MTNERPHQTTLPPAALWHAWASLCPALLKGAAVSQVLLPADPPAKALDDFTSGRFQDQCGRGSILGQHPGTGHAVVIPMCCKKWTCPACAKRLARSWARKVTEAKPERFITLTVNPAWVETPQGGYEALKKAFTKLVATWRKKNKTFEYWAIWELQENGFPHLHVLQKGDYIPQPWIAQFLKYEKVGLVQDIRQIHGAGGAAAYVVKYTGKAAGTVHRFLGSNRLITYSHHFFPDIDVTAPLPKYDGYQWTYLQVAAATVLLDLVRIFGYIISLDKFPRVLELIPTSPPTDIEQIAHRIDDRWLERCYGSYELVPFHSGPE